MAWDYNHGNPPRWTGSTPMTVPTLAEQTAHGPVLRLVAGDDHGYALTADGHIVAFGADDNDQRKDLPTQAGFVQVTAGPLHGYALTADGHIVHFGNDQHERAARIPTTGGFTQVTGDDLGGFALTSDGHIVAFGNFTYHATDNLPTQGGFVQVVGAGYGGIALTAGGSVAPFGQRTYRFSGKTIAQIERSAYALTVDGHLAVADGVSIPAPPGGGFVQFARLSALTPDGHIIGFGNQAHGHYAGLPLWPVVFDSHPYVDDGKGAVTVHVAASPPLSPSNNAGSVFPTVLPYEIEWGDGTPNTPVPVGTALTTAFTHTYADPSVDHTLRIVYPKAVRDATAGFLAATEAIDTAGTQPKPQYVYVYDTTDSRFHPADVQVYDTADSAFHAAEINVYDSATSKWVK